MNDWEVGDGIRRLEQVMRRLRDPEKGCPWDRVQTHRTLKSCLLGEAAEFFDAVDASDDANMREELGDLLMQIVLNAVIAEERGAFTLADVIRDVTEKMIRRHPHVFAEAEAENVSDVLRIWDSVKKEEKGKASASVSRMARIPRNLPALLRAEKIQKKAAEAGFDWPDEAGVRAKFEEEMNEVREAFRSGADEKIEEELGDLLFTVVNLARFRKGPSASDLLQRASDKFLRRFAFVEDSLRKADRKMEDASPDELDALWRQAKMREKEGL